MNDTPCKDCVFALYEGKTQTGCAANLIEIFRHQAVTILEAYDEEREFYVIKNRICLMSRPLKWLEREPDIQKLLKIARDQIRLKYEVIILIENTHTLQDIEKTIQSIELQTLKPERIIFVMRKTHSIRPSQLHDSCFGPWKIQLITEETADKARMLDITLIGLKKKTSYFAVIEPPHTIDNPEFIEKLDNALFGQMQPILFVKDEKFYIVSKSFALNNGRGDIEAKLDQLMEEEPECKTMKRTSQEILTY